MATYIYIHKSQLLYIHTGISIYLSIYMKMFAVESSYNTDTIQLQVQLSKRKSGNSIK